MGWPGSVTDVKIWKQSYLWKHRHDYFKDGEYVLVDKGEYGIFQTNNASRFSPGYPSSPWAIHPFSEPEITTAPADIQPLMRRFNFRLSSVRIASEHAYGMLKGRFLLLKEMGKHADIQDIYKAIETLIVIHNICIDWGDKPEDIWSFDPKESWANGEDDNEDEEENNEVGGEAIQGQAEVPVHETEQWLKDEASGHLRILVFQ